MFINSFVIGFGQGFQPVCGFNYGSRIKPPCPTGILVLCESRRYLLSHLLPHRLHLCPGSSFLVPKEDPQVIAVGAEALRCSSLHSH